MAGGGHASLKGNCNDSEFSIEGVGLITSKKLKSNSCSVSVAGAGSASVWVEESLDASISGAGSIRYKGNPSNINKKISGFGRISELD